MGFILCSVCRAKCSREFEIIHAKSGLAMFACRLVVADKARDPTSGGIHHPKAVFLVPQADAEDYIPTEAAQRLLESMGRLTCALLAFPHPALRFASLEVAKSSLSDGLVVSPLAATVRNVCLWLLCHLDNFLSEASFCQLLCQIRARN